MLLLQTSPWPVPRSDQRRFVPFLNSPALPELQAALQITPVRVLCRPAAASHSGDATGVPKSRRLVFLWEEGGGD